MNGRKRGKKVEAPLCCAVKHSTVQVGGCVVLCCSEKKTTLRLKPRGGRRSSCSFRTRTSRKWKDAIQGQILLPRCSSSTTLPQASTRDNVM